MSLWICCPQCTSLLCNWLISLLLQIVIAKVRLPGKYLTGFSPQTFFILQLIPLSGFSKITLILGRLFRTFSENLASRFARPFYRLFCSQSTPWLPFSASIYSPWGWADQCAVNRLFILFTCGILSVFRLLS